MLFTSLSVDAVPRRMHAGQTTRHLHTRILEHLGISPIAGKHTSNPAKSSVLSHSCASGRKVDFENFKILFSCSDSYKLMIHESLLINKYKPALKVHMTPKFLLHDACERVFKAVIQVLLYFCAAKFC